MFSAIVAISFEGTTPCALVHTSLGEVPESVVCSRSRALQLSFRKKLVNKGIHQAWSPNAWVCLTRVRQSVNATLAKTLAKPLADPLGAFGGKRDPLRKSKRTEGREKYLQEQVENNLPENLSLFVHLEAQGYLAVHCEIDRDSIHYWYEHPNTGWVAYVRMDKTGNRVLEKRVQSSGPEVYANFLAKGVRL